MKANTLPSCSDNKASNAQSSSRTGDDALNSQSKPSESSRAKRRRHRSGTARDGGCRRSRDGFVSATGRDETNLLSSLLAKQAGARKVLSLVHVSVLKLESASRRRLKHFASQYSTVNAILRRIRRGRVMTVASLSGIEAEAIEFMVSSDSRIANKALRDVDFPKNGVIGIVRATIKLSCREVRTYSHWATM